jgi:hypothetical protein
MTLQEIVSEAFNGFDLLKSLTRAEVELVFATPEEADRFVEWTAERHIATYNPLGTREVTVYLAG